MHFSVVSCRLVGFLASLQFSKSSTEGLRIGHQECLCCIPLTMKAVVKCTTYDSSFCMLHLGLHVAFIEYERAPSGSRSPREEPDAPLRPCDVPQTVGSVTCAAYPSLSSVNAEPRRWAWLTEVLYLLMTRRRRLSQSDLTVLHKSRPCYLSCFEECQQIHKRNMRLRCR